ncbi:MAG: pyridoxal-phosphate dependent enzyme [Thermomicrobiales bacterium]|nr:pyridoxal-phosphate dependent enzyme [Thermomicrobiales bacterium]
MTVATTLRPTMDEVYAARARLRGVTVRTPLLQLWGSDSIWVKPEVLQPVGSFKIRGVYNAVASLDPDERAKGVSTVSSGNTAQAVAWAARRFGVPARAIMPTTTPENKLRATEAYGGVPDLRPAGEAFDYLRHGGYRDFEDAFIHPVANRDLLAGHGTIALEIFEDMPDVETVYVPIGGGGLISGISNALKELAPNVRIVGVQPEGCTPVIAGLAAGEPVDVEVHTICDGVAVSFMFPEMYPLLRDLVDEIVTVSDDDVIRAIRHLALRNKLVAEGAGALATAAATKYGDDRSIAMISGGSIDPAKLAEIITAED